MDKAKFLFTKYTHSFIVKILNLENLSVEQIQEIEQFVKRRNGLFDFDTYTFEIYKNINFSEFEFLMSSLNITCICSENIIFDTQKQRIDFGQYKGMFYSDLDNSYLLWLQSNYRGDQKEYINNEILARKL